MAASLMSSLDCFHQWTSKYATWSDLKAWLQATEKSVDIIETEDSPYVILRTKKDSDVDTANQSEVNQVCRSLVWNKDSNRPCCVAPFAARRDQRIDGPMTLKVEDFVEGVMINVFRYRGDPLTHVATRSRMEADGGFYSERSFRDLFDEAMKAKNTSLEDISKVIGEPDDNVEATFITLVMAHPEHRVVRSVEEANLWAIYRGVVKNDGVVEFYTDDLPPTWRPKTYDAAFEAADWAAVESRCNEIKKGKPWYWQGLVVHAGLQRWRFRNGDHDRVRRELRGSESNSFGRFLRLRASKRVQEYLRIYSEDNEAFQGFERDYRELTKVLYTWYCRCHKEHGVAFKAMPKSVQPLVFELHKYYLEKLRPASKSLRLAEVIQWITDYLKGPFGVSNVLRFQLETEKPPESKSPWPPVQANSPKSSTAQIE